MRILCSTGVFTRSSDPLSHAVISRYGGQFAVDGLEVIFYPRWYAELGRVIRTLRTAGLAFPVIHGEKGIGEAFGSGQPDQQEQGVARFERNCFFAHEISARRVVLHLWGLPQSDAHLERNLRLLTRCLDLAEGYGLALAIETIPCLAADPLTNVKRAFEEDARVRVALDTEFLAMHHQLDAVFEAAWLWQAPLVTHVHLKDFEDASPASARRRFLHPGDGQIDFGRFVRQLRVAGFDGTLSLEARGIDGEGRIEVPRIQASLRLITALADES